MHELIGGIHKRLQVHPDDDIIGTRRHSLTQQVELYMKVKQNYALQVFDELRYLVGEKGQFLIGRYMRRSMT